MRELTEQLNQIIEKKESMTKQIELKKAEILGAQEELKKFNLSLSLEEKEFAREHFQEFKNKNEKEMLI